MENKNVGWLIVGISIFIGIIIGIFNFGLKSTLNSTCTMGPSCSMYKTLALQTWISFAIALIIFFIGLFFIFAKEPERIIFKKQRAKKIDVSELDKDEKKVISILQKENGAVFQAALMEQMEIGKVKTTRILDKLEAKQLIERKRRGMNNIIVLKN